MQTATDLKKFKADFSCVLSRWFPSGPARSLWCLTIASERCWVLLFSLCWTQLAISERCDLYASRLTFWIWAVLEKVCMQEMDWGAPSDFYSCVSAFTRENNPHVIPNLDHGLLWNTNRNVNDESKCWLGIHTNIYLKTEAGWKLCVRNRLKYVDSLLL